MSKIVSRKNRESNKYCMADNQLTLSLNKLIDIIGYLFEQLIIRNERDEPAEQDLNKMDQVVTDPNMSLQDSVKNDVEYDKRDIVSNVNQMNSNDTIQNADSQLNAPDESSDNEFSLYNLLL